MSAGSEQSMGFTMSTLWALFVASAFPIGALISTYVRIPERMQADIAIASAGIFIGAIAFSLVDDAVKLGTSADLIIGFVIGAVVFSLADHFIKKRAEKKEESEQESSQGGSESSGGKSTKKAGGKAKSVLLGTFVDSTPEAIVLAVIIALPLGGLVPAAVALFLGNITAALEGTKRLYKRGGKKSIVLGGWMAVFGVVLMAGPIGFYLVKPLSNDQLAIIVGFAAGALMAFVTQELIPKAHERAGIHLGLSAVFGFLVAFALFQYIK